MTRHTPRIAVIGGGPVGLEAALAAMQAGFPVDVFERGSVAANVLDWGHVRLFSPFGLNASAEARRALRESGVDLPDNEALLTGREYAERYLLPLSRLPSLSAFIHTGTEVRAIGRPQLAKRDLIGHPERAADGFQLLVRDSEGERTVETDYVFDCSGTYPNHNWMGAGGIPCPGEESLSERLNYRLPDIPGRDRERFAGRTTLVVGGGYSAATAVVALAELAEAREKTRVVWLTRTHRDPPVERIENDALPERDRLARAANRLAVSNHPAVDWRPGRWIHRVEADDNKLRVAVRGAGGETGETTDTETITADRIIANVGYRPDRNLHRELQVHECYASEGPMKLAAALLSETSADCLAQSSPGAETLCNPEPGFFILGAKSYGRDSRFLIRTGLQQIREVLSLLKDSRQQDARTTQRDQ